MNRIRRLRTLHHLIALVCGVHFGTGCFLIYSFDAEPPLACRGAEDCPGVANACGLPVCEQGACSMRNLAAEGTILLDESTGDCIRAICDGKGNVLLAADDTDVPFDGNPCTDDLCMGGVPQNVAKSEGAQCGTISSVTCNAAGECVNCTTESDCGIATQCSRWVCSNGQCLRNIEPQGTVIDNPVPGDCRKTLCDALGQALEMFSAEDAASDEDPCTQDLCTTQGEFIYQPLPIGTSCGDCKACENGICGACNPSTSDCYAGACIGKPRVCALDSDCSSNHCVDGYCCDNECSGPCVACNEARTGRPSGLCAAVLDGTDPDNECNATSSDVCVNGICQCANGIQDGNETGTDCGGDCNPCTGIWDCNGCAAGMTLSCCYPNCSDCTDKLSECQAMQGKTCTIGTANQIIPLGTATASTCLFFMGCKEATCVCK